MATITLKARTIGADSVLRRFLIAASLLPSDTRDAQRELAKLSEVVFAAYAPVKSGRLVRGIGSTGSVGGFTVTDYARNPESGYDYVGVTRFGHSVARIYPKHDVAASVVGSGKRRRGALRFSAGGGILFRASVAAYHPASDWATDALPEVEVAAQGVATRLGRKIESRF